MPKSKSTIRRKRGLPLTRKYLHLTAELHSILVRLEHLAEAIEQAEFDAGVARTTMPKPSLDTDDGLERVELF